MMPVPAAGPSSSHLGVVEEKRAALLDEARKADRLGAAEVTGALFHFGLFRHALREVLRRRKLARVALHIRAESESRPRASEQATGPRRRERSMDVSPNSVGITGHGGAKAEADRAVSRSVRTIRGRKRRGPFGNRQNGLRLEASGPLFLSPPGASRQPPAASLDLDLVRDFTSSCRVFPARMPRSPKRSPAAKPCGRRLGPRRPGRRQAGRSRQRRSCRSSSGSSPGSGGGEGRS